jgi:hypothetical protein
MNPAAAPRDPHHFNVRVVSRPDEYAFLELMHVWSLRTDNSTTEAVTSESSGAAAPNEPTTQPRVRAFGHIPDKGRNSDTPDQRAFPNDDWPNDFPDMMSKYFGTDIQTRLPVGWWRPLVDTQVDEVLITLPMSESAEGTSGNKPNPALQFTEDGEQWYMGYPIPLYTHGTNLHLVTIEQPAVFANSAANTIRSLICGHYVG